MKVTTQYDEAFQILRGKQGPTNFGDKGRVDFILFLVFRFVSHGGK